MEVQFSQKIRERYPTMRLGLVEVREADNSGARELRDERKTVERIVKKEYRNWEKVDILKAYDKFFGRHKRPFPIVEGLKAILNGRGIPTLSPLVDAMLLSELKHLVLMTAHDMDRIEGTLTVDQALEGEEFTNIAGDSVALEQGDVVVKDSKGIIATYLEGQSIRTKVSRSTSNCAYFAFYVPGVKDIRIKNCLKDAAKLASAAGGKPSGTELHIPGKEVKTGVVSTERINPWGEQKIRDYDKLLEEFGISKFRPMVSRLPSPHPLMQRGIVFGHRDFSIIADAIQKGRPWAMMTGLMPSGKFHFGHKMLADQIIYYQSIGARIYLCVADIEAYNMRQVSFKELKEIAINEYLLNYIALGLEPENVDFYFQSDRHSDHRKSNAYYRLIGIVSKKPTMNEMKAIYGDLTPGKITSIMTQVADILHPMLPEFEGRKAPVVVPVGIDQDPHLRLTRDIANRIKDEFGFIPPASTYHMFMKGLKGGKMASSDPGSHIALSDQPKAAAKKLSSAFTGGRGNAEEQRKLGADPDVCTVYDMYAYHLAKDARHLEKVRKECKTGKRLCGECKKECAELLTRFLEEHQRKREKAKKLVARFIK